MVGENKNKNQQSLFSQSLKTMLNPKEPIYILADTIKWKYFEKEFEKFYINFGRPSKPIRLMVSLLILKQLYSLSDERVVEEWVQNPYYQYFSGMAVFQWKYPCTPSELTHFRNRIGKEGSEMIFKNSIELHGKSALEKEVLVDSTVQEKNITYPTDLKLHVKIIKKCREISKQENIKLRQSYRFTIPPLIVAQKFKNHPKNKKKARKAEKRIKTITGAILRDLDRKLLKDEKEQYEEFLKKSFKILKQQRTDKDKFYSLHEEKIYCIAKGKAHKKYEFGTKASIVKTIKSGIIIGAMNIHNQFDGHSLKPVLNQVEILTGKKPKVAIVDRGYAGKKEINGIKIERPCPPKKNATDYEKRKARKRFRSRAGIEPIIGHLKHDHRMLRNFLKGELGDDMNIMLSAAAFNYKKMLNQIKFSFSQFYKVANFQKMLPNFTDLSFEIKNKFESYLPRLSENLIWTF